MKGLKRFLNHYYNTIICLLFICFLSTGCISELKRLRQETASQSEKIAELEAEKNRLSEEIESIRKGDLQSGEVLEGIMRTAEDKLKGTGVMVKLNGKEGVSLVLPSSFFDPGSTKLKNQAKSHLKKISKLINDDFYRNIIRIEGHTDNQPIRRTKNIYKSNWELSTARATSVLYYLINECRVNPTRMYIAGFGEYKPVADNNSKSGREKNRRIEIVVIPKI